MVCYSIKGHAQELRFVDHAHPNAKHPYLAILYFPLLCSSIRLCS